MAPLTLPGRSARRLGVGAPAALALMLASGFSGLGLQIVWTRQGALWLGHETAAVLAVVAAFFAGLALGASTLGAWLERGARPALGYALCEAVIGLWGLVLAAFGAQAGGWLAALAGPAPAPAWQWTVAFAATFVLLLPATAAMGATLPALQRALAGRPGGSVAALYAANTAGAVLGVLVLAFWLVPSLGLLRSAALCAALNLGCALLALPVLGAGSPPPQPRRDPQAAATLLPRLAATGLLGIGYEVVVVRVLGQVAEDTVYTFALLLAVYLVGSAAGAAWQARWPAGSVDGLLRALAAACLAGGASLWFAPELKAAVLASTGGGYAAALAAEAVLALAAFFAPTVLMGALFARLAEHGVAAGLGLGRLLGLNTLGAAAAPLAFGVGLLPAVGAKVAIVAIAAGYLALGSAASLRSRRSWAVGAAAGGMALVAPALVFVDLPPGGRLLQLHEGAMASVSVVEDASGSAWLKIDNRAPEGSSATRWADARQAWLPLLLHPDPRHVLFLGLGTGVTAASAAEDPRLSVDAVELVPEVAALSPRFTAGFATADRLHLVVADARRHVRASDRLYELVVADNVHPARSGSGSLLTVEHFAAVHARLAAGGLFCQWLPLHQMDLESLRSVVRAFREVWPGAVAVLATNSLDTPVVGLIGRAGGMRLTPEALRERLRGAPQAARWGLDDEFALLGSVIAGPRALARFAADAPLNTDDRPVVAYRAPRLTYAPDSRPRDRLLALLGALDVAADELPADPGALAPRLAAYRQARDLFLAAGRDVVPSADPRRMLAQVQAPLLAALRLSPDFRPAYEPLVAMAAALAARDRPAARSLLAELHMLQPAWPEAGRVLEELR
ncbi:spermine/spermidine synthase domain-containing protein [Rubrivivax gelatinosus]|uniref:Spermidine synthase n=1 Tax=Rubrivivax gelatinosus TaxID=28068 RepID=A0A4R2M090_RUBGE|nr:spermidine synthase [Rubrivivax gelatinosus]MBK1688024.1 spermidine synthase [Rubrivivax gelatinosus]TCO99309.1 spermidine synthase [Rubrivivax gelatinosus]